MSSRKTKRTPSHHARPPAAVALLLALLPIGCGPAMQKVSVTTVPGGAEVFLQRQGEVKVDANVAGVSGQLGAGTFEEEEISLGTSPVEYEFQLEEKEVDVDRAGVSGKVTRRYTEGVIRVELAGYRPAERRVRFSGDAVSLRLDLQPSSGN